MKNIYELSPEKVLEYRKEFEKTGYNKGILTVGVICVVILYCISIFLLMYHGGSFVEKMIDHVVTTADRILLVVDIIVLILTLIYTLFIIYIWNNNFKRWLKVKHKIEY